MKRRSFLGLFGTAVVAGPAAAKNAVTDFPRLSGTALGAAGNFAGLAVPPLDPAPVSGGWTGRRSRMAQIAGFLRGEFSERDRLDREARALYESRTRIEYQINALGSVSPAHKVAMFQRESARIHARQEKAWWQIELWDHEENSL